MPYNYIHAIRDGKPLNYSAAREGQPGLKDTLQLEDQRWQLEDHDHAADGTRKSDFNLSDIS